jgi:A/G-specific adenine glycosylase
MRPHANVPTPTTSGTEALSASRIRLLRSRILEWGLGHRREFPWRTTGDPWRVLVSEVMLQQTQADRVVGYYSAFLERFPTPDACARARTGEVVRLWAGLGYNRRALNLHRTATMVTESFGGVFPKDEKSLRALPGVGPSTARAILSFAFGVNVATVDTNVVRVLSRCVAGTGLSLAEAQSLADRLVPAGHSWEFNQTMFDIGATVCTGRRPDCDRCPLRPQCRWTRAGLPEPDPWRASNSVRRQKAFVGSDRQGRGRLVQALRQSPLPRRSLPDACGWPDDIARSLRITEALVAEGFAEWRGDAPPMLHLR